VRFAVSTFSRLRVNDGLLLAEKVAAPTTCRAVLLAISSAGPRGA
jgi:hypothetical protein